MAGVLRMPWRKFAVYNFLGAAAWVATISSVGYLLGRHWDNVVQVVTRVNGVVILALALLLFYVWWHKRRRK
jgi:membrane-associated protein